MSRHLMRTLVFAGIAVVCVAGAVLTNTVTRGKPLDDTALVGQEYFPDLADDDVTALQVAVYDEDAADVNLFKVEFKDGLWRIPSHHDYPADGEELLAKTAASVVGLTRGTFAGKTEADQRRTRTLDPLDESIAGTEGRGDRITLFKGNTPVVDLIVGDRTDDEAGDVYYVREADNPRIYRTRMSELKVSTRFADWIEPDLLQLDRNKLTEMVLDRYHVDEQQRTIVPGEITQLKKNDEDKWELADLDEATEELVTATVNDMTFALGDMKIVGVRPKPSGLVKLLTSTDGRVSLSDIEMLQMRSSMQRAGFFFTGDNQIVSNEGEFRAGTNEGVVYQLRFGEVFSGTDVEIEVGSAIDEEEQTSETEAGQSEADSPDDATEDEPESEDDADSADDSAVKRNRYLLVMAHFDESLLGDPPQEPVKPEPPADEPESEDAADSPADADDGDEKDAPGEETSEEPAEENPATPDESDDTDPESDSTEETTPADEEASSDQPATEDSPDEDDNPDSDSADEEDASEETEDKSEATTEESDADDAPQDDAAQEPDAAEEPVDPQKAYEEALAKYDQDLKSYEREKQAYDEKVENGRQQVEDLNRRFAAWYYVISAELFDQLHVSRDELVKAKEPAEGDDTATEPDGEDTGDSTTPESDDNPDPQPEADADKPQSDSDSEAESEPSESEPSEDDTSSDDETSDTGEESKPGTDTTSDSDAPADDDTAD